MATTIHKLIEEGFSLEEAKMAINLSMEDNAEESKNESMFCGGNITQCPNLRRLCQSMSGYTKWINIREMDPEFDALNDFLHLMKKHHKDTEFDYIYSQLGGLCDVKQCKIHQRNYRSKSCKNNNNINQMIMVQQQIMDKIHCFYTHSYDIGHRLTLSDKQFIAESITATDNDSSLANKRLMKIKNILSKRHKLFDSVYAENRTRNFGKFHLNVDNFGGFNESQSDEKTQVAPEQYQFDLNQTYSYGHIFEYKSLSSALMSMGNVLPSAVTNNDNKINYNSTITQWDILKPNFAGTVFNKYRSFKQELLSNQLSTINIQQFQNEHKKAKMHFHSFYCKEFAANYEKRLNQATYGPIQILSVHHLLSVMLYCNYDYLQYEFSKTYRKVSKNESNESLVKRHSNFYFLAKYLWQSVNHFGTTIQNGRIQSFYHGISQKLSFPAIVGNIGLGVEMYCPLSTSAAYEVAVNFANYTGLVIEFRNGDFLMSSKYFAADWLSDYGNESEYLFIQNNHVLRMHNIIDITTGCQYKIILRAIKKIYEILRNSAKTKCSKEESLVMEKLIHHQLSLYLEQYPKWHSLREYGKELMNVFCSNTVEIRLIWGYFKTNQHLFEMFACTDCEWIDMKVINVLFPNIGKIVIKDVMLTYVTMNNILMHLTKYKQSKLKTIEIEIAEDSILSLKQTVSEYTDKFNVLHFNVSNDKINILRIIYDAN